MNIINKQCNSIAPLLIDILAFPLALFPKLVIELHEEQHLIPHIREKIVFTNQIKDVRAPQPKEVRQGFPRLAICSIPVFVHKRHSKGVWIIEI